MRRRALLVPVLLLSLAPTAGAQACGGPDQYVDTLTVSLPTPPASVRAGSATQVPVSVTRAGTPAGGLAVYLRLQHGPAPEDVSYGSGRTAVDGRTTLLAVVPRGARGRLRVNVEAFHPVAEVPCYGTIIEHGLAEGPWGRVAG